MTQFNDQIIALDDAALEEVAGGFDIEQFMSPQLRLAYHPVGGWTMPDPFAKPVLGQYTPR
jgi:hypothetical protein